MRCCVDSEHRSAFACSRCNGEFCFECALPIVNDRPVKTIAGRYCADWRCQREMRIESGQLLVTEKVNGT
jgi:hypothetical protein